MRAFAIFGCFLLLACGSEPKEKEATATPSATSATVTNTSVVSTDTNNSFTPDNEDSEIILVPVTRKPSGVYRLLLPQQNGTKVLHTISFYPSTFRMQEEYRGKKDSVVVTEGTWAPSEGSIWLYKDQIMRGRYSWKGDTLQFVSPQLKKTFSMQKLVPATVNAVWQTKKKEGSLLYGVGTEPFWSVEISSRDSVVVNMPDWNAPLQAKLTSRAQTRDSAVYAAANDSLQVTVYPLFCSDGMSDFLYTQKIKLLYKGQTYTGCGEVLQKQD